MSLSTDPAVFTKLGFDPAYLPTFEDKTFIEGPQTARRLVNFFTLLLLATVIATYGVLSNSTATVIGAMIVAPLMGPIVAITAAVVMGSFPRALRAFALTIVGTVSVIIFSYLLSWIVPDFTISFTSNAEITSRISPDLYALLTAMGAGAAGAFILSRSEIADSIGGVAIAISLVPPLCVVGIALRQGEWGAAVGAFLLFVTNFLAILLAGGAVLTLIGLGKLEIAREQARLRRGGLLLFLVCILLIAIPLSLAAYQRVVFARENTLATVEAQQWLQGTSYQLDMVEITENTVSVTVEGTGQYKPIQLLANQLASTFGHPILLNVHAIPTLTGQSSSP